MSPSASPPSALTKCIGKSKIGWTLLFDMPILRLKGAKMDNFVFLVTQCIDLEQLNSRRDAIVAIYGFYVSLLSFMIPLVFTLLNKISNKYHSYTIVKTFISHFPAYNILFNLVFGIIIYTLLLLFVSDISILQLLLLFIYTIYTLISLYLFASLLFKYLYNNMYVYNALMRKIANLEKQS